MPVEPSVVALVREAVAADEALLVEMRRDLHAHPELSGEEKATTRWIHQHLRDLGLAPVRLEVGTGVVCDVVLGSGVGPVVAVRADIDALAMNDDKDVGYRSQTDGVAHACGHDVHTTVVLGVARVLARAADRLGVDGTVRLVFEPAEESVPGGAVAVLSEGFFDDVDAVFGVHCDPKVDVGRVGLRVGPISSAADMIEVRVSGPGGHTSRPERTVDLVAVLARVVGGMQDEIDRLTGEPAAVRCVFGSVHAGDAANVIPSSGMLRGTIRTPDHDVWRELPKHVEDALATLLGGTGVTWTTEHRRGVPPVVNDEGATAIVANAVRTALGDAAAVEVEQSWGGDSFAWYLEKVPGSYARLGVHDPASGRPRLDLHAGTFDVDERAIGHGALVLALAALQALTDLS
ncbi:MAG: amidohydrolase [Candidatus Nanopelagicales bacterium]